MDRRARLTPLGGALIALLVLAIVAILVGSRTLQTLGFIVLVIALLVIAGDQLPRLRVFGRAPADTLPTPETVRRRRAPRPRKAAGSEDPQGPSGRARSGPTGSPPGRT